MAENLRKIIHIDMDAFFAAIEQREHPQLRGKPVIVGGDPKCRGVVCTCSYEARPFGIHAGMATSRAMCLCPQGTFLPVRMELYRKVSEEIFQIFSEFTSIVEPMSIDEAYLDVTVNHRDNPSATHLAKEIQRRIFQETGLSSSAGISHNLFLAKIASAMKKPGGVTVIHPKNSIPFLESLPIEKFYGIGRVTAKRLREMRIHYGKDLKELSLERLMELLGKRGIYYYHAVRGIDRREVTPVRARKSIGREITFPRDSDEWGFLREQLLRIGEEVACLLFREGLFGRTLILKVKYGNFQQITRSHSPSIPLHSSEKICALSLRLLRTCLEKNTRKIRLIGIAISKISPLPQGGFSPLLRQQEFDFIQNGTFLHDDHF
ncbi:MAG: DNA polymerase IV [Puniceicoccales bacterium]|jgi:DNA polymerase-4|nr:DNA polymerase IV [Puniceicoccales bacterium]